MILIGIDFSITSPAICVYDEDASSYEFISIPGVIGKAEIPANQKAYFWHRLLKENNQEVIVNQRVSPSKEYIIEQRDKLKEADKLSDMILDIIKLKHQKSADIRIGIEGFSYASQGQSFIDLIMYNSIMRDKLAKEIGFENIYIFSPTEVKKFATTKGNADKEKMIKAFLGVTDPELIKTPFFNMLNNNEIDFKNVKPIDDIIDAYWMMSYLRTFYR